MSKLSDKKFILILIVLGIVYFFFINRTTNESVKLDQVRFTVGDTLKSLSDYQGEQLVVNFYASWCKPCMNELPAMARTANEWEDVTFLWLTDEDNKIIERSRSQFNQSTFYQLSDRFKTIGIESIPYTVVYNKAGEVVYAAGGELNWDDPLFKSEILGKLN